MNSFLLKLLKTYNRSDKAVKQIHKKFSKHPKIVSAKVIDYQIKKNYHKKIHNLKMNNYKGLLQRKALIVQ
jgi:hypothetical protein